MKVQFSAALELIVTECPTCGVLFGIPPNMETALRESSAKFYCPSGHSQSYQQSESDRLRKELEQTQTKLAEAQMQSKSRFEHADRLNKYNTELLKKLDVCRDEKKVARRKK